MNEIKKNQVLLCQQHKNNQIIYIKVNELQENKGIFYCQTCVSKDYSFKSNNYVEIQSVLNADEDSIVFNWPPLNDINVQSQLIYFSENQQKEGLLLQDQIDSSFEKLKVEIVQKIDQTKKMFMNEALDYMNNDRTILKQYSELSKINQFKSLLLDSKINEKEKLCKLFITELLQQQENNTEQFKNLLKGKEKMKQALDLIQPQKRMQSIISKIENIKKQSKKSICILKELSFSKSSELFPSEKQSKIKIEEGSMDEEKLISDPINSYNNWSSYFCSNKLFQVNYNYKIRFQISPKNSQQLTHLMLFLVSEQNPNKYIHLQLDYQNNQLSLDKNSNELAKITRGNFQKLSSETEMHLKINFSKKVLELTDYPSSKHNVQICLKDLVNEFQKSRLVVQLYGDTKMRLTSVIQNELLL